MGWFSKERHGTLETVVKGYQYVWKIPNIRSYSNTVLDSPMAVCGSTGVDFHFHMTITHEGQISFYMHYKDIPIPKYTYYFGTPGGVLPRQHTAFRIPQETERCGHCNVVNLNEIYRLVPPEGEESLYVFFFWDRDTVQLFSPPDAELGVRWTVPDVTKCTLCPLTSKGFTLKNAVLAIRVDEAADGENLLVFLFAKEGQIPPHQLSICTDGREFASLDPAPEGGAKLLRVSKSEFLSFFSQNEMIVIVKFIRHNPLDFLNVAGEAKKQLDEAQQTKTVSLGGKEGKSQYVVMEDDV